MKIKYLLFALSFFLMSCNQQSKAQFDNYVYLTEDSIPELQELELEKVELPLGVIGNGCKVFYDSILIVTSDKPDTYALTVMNLKTGALIGEFLKNYKASDGNTTYVSIYYKDGKRIQFASNEDTERSVYHTMVISNRIFVSKSSVVTDNDSHFELYLFNIDSVLQMGQAYSPRNFDVKGRYNNVDLLTDSSFVFSNIWYLDGCGNSVNENAPELIVKDFDSRIAFEKPERAWNVLNNNWYQPISNVGKGRLAIIYDYKPQITFLNSNLDTLKIVYGPDSLVEREYEDYNDAFGLIPKQDYCYVGGFSNTENHIAVIVEHLKENTDGRRTYENNVREIFLFDWDGNIVARALSTKEVYGVSYSDETNTLYISSVDDGRVLSLYKAKLK